MTLKSYYLVILLIFFCTILAISQPNEMWTDKEKSYYVTLKELTSYVSENKNTKISNDSLLYKFIFLDYVTNDTTIEQKEYRLQFIDTIFNFFKETVDSIGLDNLDAKPIRFYKEHIIYEPFKNELINSKANVFAYYNKKIPNNPLGTLLFEPNSNKLVSWILISQGGHSYFLIFNLF